MGRRQNHRGIPLWIALVMAGVGASGTGLTVTAAQRGDTPGVVFGSVLVLGVLIFFVGYVVIHRQRSTS